MASPCKGIKNCSFLCCTLVGLRDISPVGFQSFMGPSLGRMLDVGFKAFFPQGETAVFSPHCIYLCRGWVHGERVIPVLTWVFSRSLSVQELLSWRMHFFQRDLLRV